MRASSRAAKAAPGRTVLERLLREGDFETAPVTPQQADLAADAAQRFGMGRPSAPLALSDCFAYALAQTVGQPQLFRDERFRQTDVIAALPPA